MITRFLKYSLVGISGVIVGVAAITICVELFNIDPRIAWYISTFFAILNNFTLNTLFTWPDRRASNKKKVLKRFTIYNILTIFTILINYLIYNFLLDQNVHYVFSLLVAIGLTAFLNFILGEKIVWTKGPTPTS